MVHQGNKGGANIKIFSKLVFSRGRAWVKRHRSGLPIYLLAMKDIDILIDTMAREYASTITRPLCDADILDAYKQGIRDILKYHEEHVKGK